MNAIGQILVDLGAVVMIVGWLGIVLCGFAVCVGRGFLALVVPFLAFGTALRRFPWLIWLYCGGLAFLMPGALLI